VEDEEEDKEEKKTCFNFWFKTPNKVNKNKYSK